MILYSKISKHKFKQLINKYNLQEIFNSIIFSSDYNIKYYKLGINKLFYKQGFVIIYNDLSDKIVNEKGTIFYKFNDTLITFFKDNEIYLLKIKNLDKLFYNTYDYQPCKFNHCKYLIHKSENIELCQKHIILKSLEKYIYYNNINNINVNNIQNEY